MCSTHSLNPPSSFESVVNFPKFNDFQKFSEKNKRKNNTIPERKGKLWGINVTMVICKVLQFQIRQIRFF